jgi:Amt family ammonium transporter
VEPLALAHKTRLDLKLGNTAWVRDANRVLMRQAILNVLTYALDLAQGGEVSLRRIGTGADEGVAISARRAGPPPLAGLASPSRLGVGLEICRQLLQTMGGSLETVDTSDAVWQACLVWPCSRQAALLVIDDNVNFIHLFRRYLASHAWNVVGATSGPEARQMLTELHPAVILLDVMMPKEDGWELLRTLKSNTETAQIPVIVCSVLNEPALAASLGAAGYLPKPVSQQSLLQVLEPWSPTPANLALER